MNPLPPLQPCQPAWLHDHIVRTLEFFQPAHDPAGGFSHFLDDTGQVFDAQTRHLVSSTRLVFTHAKAARVFSHLPQAGRWAEWSRHALQFVQRVHGQTVGGSTRYAWQLQFDRQAGARAQIDDPTDYAYGHAFVALAHAQQLMLEKSLLLRNGTDEVQRQRCLSTEQALHAVLSNWDAAFWQTDHGLYADERDASGTVAAYRGQNANMHACEAWLAVWHACADTQALERALSIALRVVCDLSAESDGLIWEHFSLQPTAHGTTQWCIDWDYNRGDTRNIFKPWGFQVGHQTEWAKLIWQLQAAAHQAGLAFDPHLAQQARFLLDTGWQQGWDTVHGGLIYGFAPEEAAGSASRWVCFDAHKYHWVQAETLAALALAYRQFEASDAAYAQQCLQRYQQLWGYVWQHFVDHQHGAWFRILSPSNEAITSHKCTGGKVDYHNMGACYDMAEAWQGLVL